MADLVISSGHGKLVRGASGILDEVDEARKVVEALATELRDGGFEVLTFHDDVSTTQNENLKRIVDYHNSQTRRADVSIHFNAYVETTGPMGTEVLHLCHEDAASRFSEAIASVGFINRGPKKRTDLYFLNNTQKPALLFEICFVDSQADADLYRKQFANIITAIADAVGVDDNDDIVIPTDEYAFQATGKCSYFGGPDDKGVSPEEGLAFLYDVMDAPHLFLPYQPDGTTGLARRLNPNVHYLACRWDYTETSRDMLKKEMALVRSVRSGRELTAYPSDWGPNENTGRVADLSPGLLLDLELETDDEVEVVFPYRRE